MSSFDDELQLALEERQAQHRYRQRSILSSPQGAHVIVDGQRYLAFCSNDYLGLANHHHHQLEEALADFTGRERALLFSTGYMANMAVISALTTRGDTIYEDRLNHASLIDGGLLSRAKVKRFRHNDVEPRALSLM